MKNHMRANSAPATALLFTAVLCMAPAARAAAKKKKEYLSQAEADKIRDAGMSGPRIVLYATYAGDRIKKLQYEFAHMDPADQKRTDRLNNLINAYTGCIDDAADLIDIGIEKQEEIRQGVKALQSQIKDALPYLQHLAPNDPKPQPSKHHPTHATQPPPN